MLIVFDDLHLADNETLVVVAELAEWCTSMPVLILGAFRADDVPVTSTRHLGLAGLGLEAVGEICRLYRNEGWTSADVSRILEATAGVPLHVHREAAAAAGVERSSNSTLTSSGSPPRKRRRRRGRRRPTPSSACAG